MKKSMFFLMFLSSLSFFAADFKWSHSYQNGCSSELLGMANKLSQASAARSVPTEGFSLARPAFNLKCGNGTALYEIDEQKLIRGIFFEGSATISFSVANSLEQTRMERYLGKKALENEPISFVYIVPIGQCQDLPAVPASGSPGAFGQKMLDLKQALRRALPGTLCDIINSQIKDPRDIMILFELKGDIWAYRFDSGSETEVQFLRLAHSPGSDYFKWDDAVVIHESKGGTLTPEITPQEIESKIMADTRSYDINYTLDDNGKIIKGEVAVKIFLKKPHSALTFSYFPNYKIEKVSVNGEDARFLKENYSEAWGYYESGLLVWFKAPKEGEITVKFETSGNLFKQAEGYLYLEDEDLWYPYLGDWDGATYNITMTVPKENEAITIGELKNHTTNPDTTETFVWESSIPLKLATFVMGKFIHKKLDAEGLVLDVALPKGVRSNYMTQAQDYTLNELKNNVIFYSKMFGPLPYPTLKVAVTPYSHGRGFPTMLLLTDGAFFRFGSTWPDQLLAHETAHQWWGNLVDGLSYRDLWLSEGMAEFSSMAYMKLRFGEEKIKLYNENELLRGSLPKTSPEGPTIDHSLFKVPSPPGGEKHDLMALDSVDIPFDEGPICLGHRLYSTCTTQPGKGYNSIVYTKGNFVFQMLWSLSKFTKEGTTGFFKGFQNICSKYKGQSITTPMFFRELQDSMKVPLSVFLKSWYEGTGIPKVDVTTSVSQSEGKFIVNAQAKTDMDFFFGVPVRVTLPDKKQYDYILLFQNREASGAWTVPLKPKDIEVDPFRVVFCTYGKVKN